MELDATEKIISVILGGSSIILFVFRKLLKPRYKKFKITFKNLFAVLKRLDKIEELLERNNNAAILTDFLSKLLLDKYLVGIYISDKYGQAIWTNETYQTIFDADPSELLGDGWVTCLHVDDTNEAFLRWHKCINENIPYKARYRVVHKDGSIVQCETSAEAIKDAKGNIIGFVGELITL